MWQTIGHEKAINALERSHHEGRVSHSFLIVGPAQVGKMTLAMDFARMVNCIGDIPPCSECGQCKRIDNGLHPDLRVVGIESQKGNEGRARVSIGIDQVREIQKEAHIDEAVAAVDMGPLPDDLMSNLDELYTSDFGI